MVTVCASQPAICLISVQGPAAAEAVALRPCSSLNEECSRSNGLSTKKVPLLLLMIAQEAEAEERLAG